MFKKVLVPFLLLIGFGCAKKKGELSFQNNAFRVMIHENDLSNENILDYFEVKRVTPLETKPSCIIHEINGLVLANDSIFILDHTAGALLVFNENGEYLNQLKKLGKGPNEYTLLSDFDVHNGKIYVSDLNTSKFITYGMNFKAIDETRKFGDIKSFCMIDGERFVYSTGNLSNDLHKVDSKHFNNVGFRSFNNFENSYLPYHISHEGRTYVGGSSEFSFIQQDDSIYYFNSSSMIVYKAHKRGVSEYFRIDKKGEDFSEATMEYNEYESKIREEGEPRLLYGLNVGLDYVYYQFFMDESTYRGVYLKNENRNVYFPWKDLVGQMEPIPYKGKDVGLICSIDPTLLEKQNSFGNAAIHQALSNSSPYDNPILVFLRFKSNSNELDK